MGIKLRVGGRYMTRGGWIVVVESQISDKVFCGRCNDGIPWRYYENGRIYATTKRSSADCVREMTMDGLASQFIRLWNCSLIAIPSVNGRGVDVLRHDAGGARMEATYPTLQEALRRAH